jgi:iron(III) transport system ATP-binding protein
MSHLTIKGLCKDFEGRGGTVPVVKDLSLSVEKGEFVTLIGQSGCGKTTVLRLVAGLENPTAGRIFLGGTDITDLPPERRDIAMVFQHYALFPHMDVFNNVEFGLKLKKNLSKAERRERVRHFLSLVGLADYAQRMPSQLSGGQQQRVALVRALVTEPKVLLCDEPLSNLDADMRVQMRGEIKKLHREIDATTMYVTHDHDEARAIADRIVVMKDGEIASASSLPHSDGCSRNISQSR